MKMLDVSVREAKKNNMGIDMNTGTGWPFGGPQITPELGASRFILQNYLLKSGSRLAERIIPSDVKQQIPSVQLQAVTGYGPGGKIKDLTGLLGADGVLNWTAEQGDWEIWSAFCGKTLQKVKRAAPGGEGLTFDHFSGEATKRYLSRFDSAFQHSSHGVQTFFNDSYELFGTSWTPSLFDEFLKRRGYPLQNHLRELAGKKPSSDLSCRIQSDYRETISDLLQENFTRTWTDWAHSKRCMTRNQAHGSPGNLLDLYATVDIPECETFGSSHFSIPGLRRDSSDIRNVDPDPVMLKFASSAAHVSGKNLTSCETFTWLAEHFRVSLSQCKPEVEQAFLSGVNHVFYHGTAYSPSEAGWPGWLFYASVNFSVSNSFWNHIHGLNDYITRCQSILQSGVACNDLLVYWPVYDIWMNPDDADLQLTIHSIDKWLYPAPFYSDVKELMKGGYSLDFVSDNLLSGLTVKEGLLRTRSGSTYRLLIVPTTKYMPVATIRRLKQLAGRGAKIIFQQLPGDVPGMGKLEERRAQQKDLLQELQAAPVRNGIKSVQIGSGEILVSDKLRAALELKNVERETLVDSGLNYIRRKSDQGIYYYLVNHSAKTIDSFVPLNEKGRNCLLLDPQTGQTGIAETKNENGVLKVRLQLAPGEAMFVLLSIITLKSDPWKYVAPAGSPLTISGPWTLKFKEGGALIPAPVNLQKLVSWTELQDQAARNFSGTAVYSASFELRGKPADEYLLDLGKVCESARVKVNGKDTGILWSIPFSVRIGKFLKPGENKIDIEVANLMANRIRQMDQQKIQWRNYHEINFVNIDYKPFDAATWQPMPSGLLGPVVLKAFQVN